MKSTTKTLFAAAVLIISSAGLFVNDKSPTYADMKDGMVADWERAKAFTLEYLEAMPEEGYNYKPVDGIRTFEELMLHMAQGNIGLVANATNADRIYTDIANYEAEESFKGKENVTRVTTEVYDWVIDAIKNWDMDNVNEMVGPNENFIFPRIEWLKKGFEHQTHHRGQATIYLRMKGIKPPAEKLF